LKQANGLDLGKLLAAYYVYYKVIYDQISVLDASTQLDELMVAPPKYKLWQQLIIGGLASALIQPSGEFPFYFQRDAINSIVLHQHSTVRSSTVSSVSPSAHSSSSYKSVSLATTYTPVSSSACHALSSTSRLILIRHACRIVIATINAFLAAALASTRQFCFAAVASGSVVLILPGYIVLCGSLELANRSIISGSVRLVFSILYR
jgi:uncharacterized membrane protein YjjP (DUF1212 family)